VLHSSVKTNNPAVTVETVTYRGIVADAFRFAAYDGPIAPIPRHAHESYQIGLTLTNPGRYWYRGATLAVPPHSLSVLHPGEAHAIQNARLPGVAAEFRTLYIPPAGLEEVGRALGARRGALPIVGTSVIVDAALTRLFLAAHRSVMDADAPLLARDERLLWACGHLLRQCGERRAATPIRPDQVAVARAREYLHAHHADNVSLAQLAAHAGIGRFHLARMFRRVTGVAPHAYLVQVRVDQAKALLAARVPPARVARETGFAHQSHLGLHFKRLVGVTPGRYYAGVR